MLDNLVVYNLLCITANYMIIWFAYNYQSMFVPKFRPCLWTSCSNKQPEIFVGYLASDGLFATFLVHFTLMITKILLVVASPGVAFIETLE